MHSQNLATWIFSGYALTAVLVGCLANRPKTAFLCCLGAGAAVCVLLRMFAIFIEMGGLFHAWAFAGFSAVVCKAKLAWFRRDDSTRSKGKK
jgi:hypothetical protein